MRDKKGFSLVTMLTISMIATLVVSGLLAAIAPVFRTVSGDPARLQLKNFAEGAVDYVIAQLNDPDLKASVSPADEIGSDAKKIVVTSSDLGLSGNLTANVTVSNDMPSFDSRVFNPSLAPNAPYQDSSGNVSTVSQSWSFFADGNASPPSNKAWRTVTAVVSLGALTETVAVAAQIDYEVVRGASGPNARPFFPYAALGSQTIAFKNNSSTYGFTSGDTPILDSSNTYPLGGDIAAYHQASFDSSGVKIGGSLDVPSINSPSNISADSSGATTINRYLTVNDTAPSFDTPDVLGMSNPSAQIYPDGSRSSNIEINQTNAQQQLAPAPSLPIGTKYTVGGDMLLNSGSSLTGNYQATSLGMTSGSINATNASIYVKDLGSTDQVVDITGSINPSASKSSSDFQIWYNGRGKISVKASAIRATIYAPNAEVEISGIGASKGSFRGAIVAKNLTASNVDIGFDQTLSTSSSQKYDASQLSGASKYKVVSYKEITATKTK
ncbi:MAG TPA: hypothetical protein EYN91_25300 [Candidatus Melainabacteria bacterium]|nr:hypothetical protein [Candidatus Melainabacteria bacterium]